MTSVRSQQDVYFAEFEKLSRSASEPAWLASARRAALDRFGELGFPTTKLEAWKYTSVARIASTPFQLSTDGAPATKVRQEPLFGLRCPRLVLVNGKYSAELSSPGAAAGLTFCSLREALEQSNPLLEQHLARYADFNDHTFVALNTAFIQDGAFIEIPKGAVFNEPLLLLYISTGAREPAVTHPRNLVLAGRESQVKLIEAHVGWGEGVYFTNAVSEIVLGEGAVVDYCKLQQEGAQGLHVATVQFHQERSSTAHSASIAFGSALAREEMRVVLGGEGAESLLYGLYVLRGEQHVDNQTIIDHARPHCSSREVYKGVLEGHSAGVFNGRIIVRKDAQKTDSKQSNKNLVLSEDAVINTKPQLEIYADDVKCTHGATIGQIDQDALFYLRSRGIDLPEARRMLIEAFAGDILERVSFEPLRAELRRILSARLKFAGTEAAKDGVASGAGRIGIEDAAFERVRKQG